jgi:hypothetical protein
MTNLTVFGGTWGSTLRGCLQGRCSSLIVGYAVFALRPFTHWSARDIIACSTEVCPCSILWPGYNCTRTVIWTASSLAIGDPGGRSRHCKVESDWRVNLRHGCCVLKYHHMKIIWCFYFITEIKTHVYLLTLLQLYLTADNEEIIFS